MLRRFIYILLVLFAFNVFVGFTLDRIPRWFKAHFDYVNERYESSAHNFSEALSGEDDSVMLYNKGTAEYKAGNYNDAEESFSKSAEANPEFASSWYNQGNARFRNGNLHGAIESYEKTLEIDPDDEDALYNLEFIKKLLEQYQGINDGDQDRDQQSQQSQSPSDSEDTESRDDEQGSDQQGKGKESESDGSEDPGEGRDGKPEDSDQDKFGDGGGGVDDSDQEQPSQMDVNENLSGLSDSQIQQLLDALEMQERALAAQMLKSPAGQDDDDSNPMGLIQELWSIREDIDPFARTKRKTGERDEIDW